MEYYSTLTPALERPELGPDYPLIPFDPAYKRFLNEFYLLMDSPNEHEKYSQCFTPDATVIMGEKEARGREGKLDWVMY